LEAAAVFVSVNDPAVSPAEVTATVLPPLVAVAMNAVAVATRFKLGGALTGIADRPSLPNLDD
jgi:hypothetical protein